MLRDLLGNNRLKLVDVGARSGIADRWRPFSEMIDAVGFEPEPMECARLNAATERSAFRIKFLPYALGAQDNAQAVLNICRQPGCSSVLAPNLALVRKFSYGTNLEVDHTLPLTLHRLDTVCRGQEFSPDVLKIDTQGSELDILRGAGDLLAGVQVVELEVEFLEQYIGQPLFSDIDQFMRGNGFSLHGLRRTLWRRTSPGSEWPQSARGGQIAHGDALYINDKLIDDDSLLGITQAVKLLICLSAYRQDDLCLSLLSRPHPAMASLSLMERQHLASRLVSPSRGLIGRLVSKCLELRPNRELRRLIDSARPVSAIDWHDPDFY